MRLADSDWVPFCYLWVRKRDGLDGLGAALGFLFLLLLLSLALRGLLKGTYYDVFRVVAHLGFFVLSDGELCRGGVAMGWAVGRPLDWDSLRITLSNNFWFRTSDSAGLGVIRPTPVKKQQSSIVDV